MVQSFFKPSTLQLFARPVEGTIDAEGRSPRILYGGTSWDYKVYSSVSVSQNRTLTHGKTVMIVGRQGLVLLIEIPLS